MSEEDSKMPEGRTAEGAALWRRTRPHLAEAGWWPVRDDEAPGALLLAAYLDGDLAEDEAARLEARLASEPALLDELLALRETLSTGAEAAPAAVVSRAQALRGLKAPARARAAAKPSLVERLFGFPLRPAVSALAGLALLLACAGAFELGRYQAERLDSSQASLASESELPVEFLMGGLL